jgi:uncharacterized membrane protein YphA (DoxX/SURF4 family)
MGTYGAGDGKEKAVRRVIDHDYLTALSRLCVGIIFIYASFYKIIEPGLFAKSIWYYHLVPGVLINLMALVLPWLELLCGLGLILGVFYRGSVWWMTVLTVIFIVALSSTIARGLSIDCGCFKVGKTATGPAWNALLIDIPVLLLCLQMIYSRSQKWMLARR